MMQSLFQSTRTSFLTTFPEMTFEPAAEADRICQALRGALANDFVRRGYVVAMSGGVDSAVCAALAAQAVGSDRVFGLFLPERESDPQSLTLATNCAARLGIAHASSDITAILEAIGCYVNRDAAIRRVVPEYGSGWKCKLALPSAGSGARRLNVTSLIVEDPDGRQRRLRPGPTEYRQIVAATNFKQRVRTMMTYYEADRLHFAVVGTPNRLEYDQGFFVKGGDGLADIKPIAHLYKSQVYQLAHWMGIPEEIVSRPPTSDTFSLRQSQEEFFFSLPPRLLDQLLLAYNAEQPVAEAAREASLGEEEVSSAWSDIVQKRRTTRYLHLGAVLVEPIELAREATDTEA